MDCIGEQGLYEKVVSMIKDGLNETMSLVVTYVYLVSTVVAGSIMTSVAVERNADAAKASENDVSRLLAREALI